MSVKDWVASATPTANGTVTDATYGDINFAEGQAPNTVNDSVRALMSQVRGSFYNTLEWRDFDHTPVRTGNTTFTISSASDLSSTYVVGRRIKCTDSSTLYGTITASSYAAATQTVTVLLDSGSLSASLSAVALGFDKSNTPMIGSVRGFFAYKTADQTIATGTGSFTGVTFGTETYDTETSHVTGTGVVTIPAWATKVRWSVSVEFASNSTGRRLVSVVQQSGTTSHPIPYWVSDGITGGATFVGGTTGWITVTAGATYRVEVAQDSGGNLDVLGTNDRTYFSAEFAP